MATIVRQGFDNHSAEPLDARYFNTDGTPYVNSAQVFAQIPEAERHMGQTVNIAGREYWFKNTTTLSPKLGDVAEQIIADAKGYSESAAASAQSASDFADESQGFRNEAEGFKNAAGQSASNASDSESAAEGFASAAEQSKNYASGYADAALQAANSVKPFGNNIFQTLGDESTIDNIFYGNITRRMVYSSIRSATFLNCDSRIKRTVRIIWNGYNDFLRVILSYYNTETSAWHDEFDSGNLAIASVNPTHSAIVPITITNAGGKIVKLLIDTSILTYPFASGTDLNALNGTPEWVFSQECYELSNQVNLPKGDKAQIRLFPNTKLAAVSFQFDDCAFATDPLVVALFDEYGVKCNFSFIASDSNIATISHQYLAYQRKGYGICSHSIDGNIFNTSNYNATTALAALQNSKNKLEKAGFVINGFVAPSSQLDASFIDSVRNTYSYAYTYQEGSANDKSANPCNQIRESIEASTLAYAKGRIDVAIAFGYNLTFYGHTANFGTVNGTSGEMWDIAKLRSLLEYAIAKRDAGLIFLGNSDECNKYYFNLDKPSNDIMFTPEGGLAVRLLNKTGTTSVKGSLVAISSAVDSSFTLQTSEYDVVGVVYNAVADGKYCWVVKNGIAQVLYKNTIGSTRGNTVVSADTDGRAVDIAIPTGSPTEIGKALETKAGGTNVLVKCLLRI